MWVTSQPLEVEEAKEALRRAVPDIDVYLEKGQIEIIPYTYWYVKEGVFDSERVLNDWIEKLNQALASGYDGLRLSGNTFWLEKEDWNDFVEYEEEIDRIIGSYQMMALCTYSLDKCNATEIIDVVINHQFALIKKEGKWEQIESSSRQNIIERKRAEEACTRAKEAAGYHREHAGYFLVQDHDLRSSGFSIPHSHMSFRMWWARQTQNCYRLTRHSYLRRSSAACSIRACASRLFCC